VLRCQHPGLVEPPLKGRRYLCGNLLPNHVYGGYRPLPGGCWRLWNRGLGAGRGKNARIGFTAEPASRARHDDARTAQVLSRTNRRLNRRRRGRHAAVCSDWFRTGSREGLRVALMWLWVALRRHTFFRPSTLDFRPSALVSRSFFVCLMHFVICPAVFGVKPRLERWHVDGLRSPRAAARTESMASTPSSEVAILSDFACIPAGLAPACGGVSLCALNHYR
jgi:hypothetical protein